MRNVAVNKKQTHASSKRQNFKNIQLYNYTSTIIQLHFKFIINQHRNLIQLTSLHLFAALAKSETHTK